MNKLHSLKNMFLIGFGILFFVVFLSSCKKDSETVPTQPESTKDIEAPAGFDWKTSREITLNVIGLKAVNPNISNTMYVNSPAGATYYKDLLTMNKDYTIKFAVPTTETSVVLKYGSKIKTIELTSSTITFDYIIE